MRNDLVHRWRAAAGTLLAIGLVGCADFDRLELRDPQGPPDKFELSGARITLVEGVAATATAVAYDTDGGRLDDCTLHTDDSAALGVAAGPKDGAWVFYGRKVGTGEVRVRVDGDQVTTIPFEVRAP